MDWIRFCSFKRLFLMKRQEILPGEIRFQMVQLAIADNPYFCVSDMEIVREGNSYTCETLPDCMRSIRRTNFIILSVRTTLFQMEFWKIGQIFTSALR